MDILQMLNKCRKDAGQDECRTGIIQDRIDAGQNRNRTEWIQDTKDAEHK